MYIWTKKKSFDDAIETNRKQASQLSAACLLTKNIFLISFYRKPFLNSVATIYVLKKV